MQLPVNGVETFVATGGREFEVSPPTVVLLHGAGFDHSAWALHSRWFAHHGYGVLAPDLPVTAALPVRRCARSPRWRTGRRHCWRRPGWPRRNLSATPWDR